VYAVSVLVVSVLVCLDT